MSTKTKKPYVRKWVTLYAVWGNDDCEADIRMSRRQWNKILNGEEYSDSKCYWYEGERYTSYWAFNATEPGSLEISGDDGRIAIDGTISDIHVDLPE